MLEINGLPVGTNADVSVTGSTFSRTASASSSWSDVQAGRYTVRVRTARGVQGSFAPDSASFIVDVLSGGPPTVVRIGYRALASSLAVQLSGVPGGAEAPVRVLSPSGDTVAVPTSRVLTDSARGVWRVFADTLAFGGVRYAPTPLAVDAGVLHGDTATVPVVFAVASGSLALAFTGLPDGVNPQSRVEGPNGFAQVISATSTLTGLTPGDYRVITSSVAVGSVEYAPDADTLLRTVSASLVAAPASVQYRAQVGQLVLTINGLPSGATPNITVAGTPGTYSVAGDTTFSALPRGMYTVSALPLIFENVYYAPGSASTSVMLNTGDSLHLDVVYSKSAGTLSFTVAGLPAGVPAHVNLSGPNGFAASVPASRSFTDLVPGDYFVSANDVMSGGSTFAPNPRTFKVTVEVNATALATVSYAAPSRNFAIQQVHVTQATQRFDGTLPLVADRDALLRVFVTANSANTAKPDVRVRVYDGSTLLSTTVIAAPEASVRQSLAPTVLASSWNMIVPAQHMRAGLRVLAELDPQSLLQEAEREDNVWPQSGSPQALATYTVPSFRVRFVPVVIGALTGNVSSSNTESFLESARLMFPLNDISADVRAPFTSSATELQANDGNGNWLTVLSEINALRATDNVAEGTHYYGVVGTTYNSGVAGYGYLPGRAAIGWDKMPSGDGVAAHEWGHNFGVFHAPCGTSGDPRYPYANADIGQVGWNAVSNTLVQPSAKDLMSYCSNTWISDFTWSAVMQYRGTSSMLAANSAASVGSSTPEEGLLVWGRVVDGRITLEPAFRVRAPLSPNVQGTHRVQLLDDSGSVLASVGVMATRVDHASDRDERHFAVVVPFRQAMAARLAGVRVHDVRTPVVGVTRASGVLAQLDAQERAQDTVLQKLPPGERRRAQTSAQPAYAAAASAVVDPAAEVNSVSATTSRIAWRNRAYSMAMVRDAQSGAILGFVRRSGDAVLTNGRPVEVVFSDGVRSEVRR